MAQWSCLVSECTTNEFTFMHFLTSYNISRVETYLSYLSLALLASQWRVSVHWTSASCAFCRVTVSGLVSRPLYVELISNQSEDDWSQMKPCSEKKERGRRENSKVTNVDIKYMNWIRIRFRTRQDEYTIACLASASMIFLFDIWICCKWDVNCTYLTCFIASSILIDSSSSTRLLLVASDNVSECQFSTSSSWLIFRLC